MNKTTEPIKKKYNHLINTVSIAVPIVVALLFGVRIPNVEALTFLPPIYASMNGITAALLIVALIAIKKKKVNLHENLMKTSVACSLLFLLMYVAYHMTSEPTEYLGDMKYIYYFILVSHIILSVVVIPLVLHSYVRAYMGEYKSHKKMVKYAFPVWLYVAVTGVIVYIMISPYYS
jgi:putative membrane protein